MATEKEGEPPQKTPKLVQKDTMVNEGWWEIKEPQDGLTIFIPNLPRFIDWHSDLSTDPWPEIWLKV